MNEPRKLELNDGARWMRAASAVPDLDMRRAIAEAKEITARCWRLMLWRAVLWLRPVLWLRAYGRSWVLVGSVFARSGKHDRVPKAAIVGKARTARQRRPQPDRNDEVATPRDRREAALEKVDKICTQQCGGVPTLLPC